MNEYEKKDKAANSRSGTICVKCPRNSKVNSNKDGCDCDDTYFKVSSDTCGECTGTGNAA